MEQYLIDTNVISAYFSDTIPAKLVSFIDEVINAVPNISVITQIELLCWNTDEVTLQKIENFIADCNIFEISPEVISNCVKIRKHKKIKTPDAIIASSAIANGFILITNNKRDFENIKHLKIKSLVE
jgi:predicted nucleic acid-binding protein